MNTFSLQTRLYSGPGSLKVLGRFTNKHIWIICDGFLARSPLIDSLREAIPADNRISVFSEITPDPTIGTVVQGIAQMQSLRPDVVIGFGGGSALDAAKAIVWFSRQFDIDIETCVAIPTTSGTGSQPVPGPTLPESSSAARNACRMNGFAAPASASHSSAGKAPTDGATRTVRSTSAITT